MRLQATKHAHHEPGPSHATGPGFLARRAALVVLVTATTFAVSEYALRIVGPRLWMVWDPNQHSVFRPDPQIMPGIEGESHFITDAIGFRSDGQHHGADYRILALGGSTTECLYLDQEEAWPFLLQQELQARTAGRVWVANGGKSGLNTYHHLIQVERLLDQPPSFDLVVLFVGLNDMHQRMRKGADSGAFDAWHRTHPEEIAARALAVHPDPYRWTGFPENTAIGALITNALRAADTNRTAMREDIRLEDDHGQMYARRRDMRARAEVWADAPPELSSALERYGANLSRILDHTKSAGVKTLVITHPALWSDSMSPQAEELLWLGWFEDEPWVPKGYYTSRALAMALELYNSTAIRVTQTKGVPVLDLAHMMPKSPAFFYDDCHLTEAGAHEVAEKLARNFLAADLVRGEVDWVDEVTSSRENPNARPRQTSNLQEQR